MTSREGRRTFTATATSVPARDMPTGMWTDVYSVLKLHGLECEPIDVSEAVYRLINATPVDKGGRLLPDGTVDPL